MRKFYLLSTLVLTLLLSSTSNAQDFSNKGKEFWLCFPTHVPSSNNATLSIYITSDKASSGSITMPNGAFSATFSIAANGIQQIPITWSPSIHIANSESNTVLNKSIHIKVDAGKPAVVAYAQQWAGARSAATLLLPVNVLGKKYFAMSMTQSGANNGSFLARSQFQIIAIKDNTVVKITPRKNGVLGSTFTVTLPNAGDLYQYQSVDASAATQDLTGTLIESAASGSGCAPIAVFSGSSNITFGYSNPSVPVTCSGSSYDPLWQQCYPVSTWGKNYGFMPFRDYDVPGVPYRVMASEDNTKVSVDGTVVATLNAGEIYPSAFSSTPVTFLQPTFISADKPIAVAEYAQADACTGQSGPRVGDPDMVILNPIEQNIKDITIFSSSNQAITKQYVNVLMKTTAIPSFTINGVAPGTAWQPFPTLPGYSYLRHQLPGAGSYLLNADSGFNAICYGWGNVESYSYSAGTNVRDLYQQLGVSSQYGVESTPSVCKDQPFRLKVSLPYCADSIDWDLSQFPVPPTPPIIRTTYTTCTPGLGGPDSTTVVNGVTLYWYSLPAPYTIGLSGTYTVTITVYKSTGDDCGNEQEITFDLTVYDPNNPDFTNTTPGCPASVVTFTETTPQLPKPTYSVQWDFDDPASGAANTSNVRNPTHTFSGPGTYNVHYTAITTPGCVIEKFKNVIVPDYPNGTISGDATVCVNSTPPTITFSGSDGVAPYKFTYTINGGAPQTVNSVGATATVTVPTGTAGVFIYQLTQIENLATPICSRAVVNQQATVTVNPLPTATIAGTATACINGPSPIITFTGANGTAPYTFTYTVNGGSPQTVVSIGNTVSVPASTATAGVFTYALTNVSESGTGHCSQTQSASVDVTVYPLPTATISGNATVCRNAPSPTITFIGASGNAPYQFTYTINGGPNQIVTSVGTTATVSVPTGTVGTYTYTLVSVQDANGSLCANPQSGNAIINVNPLPTATISGTVSVCQGATAPTITFTGASATAPYTFTYTINGGPNQTVTSVGNIATVTAPTGTPGPFIYTLVSVQDASASACSQLQSGTATVTVNPSPTATISGNISVCRNAPSPNVTFTGTAGTAPFVFTYNINGGPNQTVNSVGSTATVAVPTGTVGPFVYTLVSVQDASPGLCSQAQSGTVTVNVNPLPTATISGTTTVCRNAPSPSITFTGAGATAPYTFTYTINGGPNQTVLSVGNTATVSAPTGTVGTFTYALVSVQDGSATACSQAQAGSVTVTVNPLPTATIAGNITVCQNAPSPNITFTGAGTTAPYTFTYTINGGGNQTVTSVGNTATVSVPTTSAGTFTYTLVSVQDATATACSQLQGGTAIVTVSPLPTATVSGTITVCRNATGPIITFTGASGTAPYTFTYNINGGPNQNVVSVGNTATVTASTTTVGTFVYNLVSVQDASPSTCSQFQAGSAVVTVNPLPTATISGNATVCQNATSPLITFTGAGTTSPYTFTYTINGGAPQTVTSVGNTATVTVPTTSPGTVNYTLVSVQDASVSSCSQLQSGTVTVTVSPSPTATISGNIAVCQNAPPPNITFTGATGTAPYTFTYNINGGAPQTVTSVGNTATVSAPTGSVGIFNYNLLSVQDASANLCSQAQSGIATVTVNPLPTANISGTTTVCLNSPSPNVTFTGASGTAPYTFTYTINGGPSQTVVSTGNTATVAVPTGTVGPFTYTLVSVQDGSTTACSQAQTGSVTVTVNPSPTANISGAVTVCENGPSPTITFTGGGTTAPYTFTYTINNGAPQNVVSVGNIATVSVPTATPGTYTYDLVSVLDGSPTACSKAVTGSAIVTVDPNHHMNLTSAASTTTQTVCTTKDIIPITYQLSGGATGATVTFTPAAPGITSSISGNVLTIQGAPTTAGIYSYTIQTTGTACAVANSIGTLDVLQTPAVQFDPVAGICQDVPAFQLVALPGSGVFSGTGVNATGFFRPSVAGPGDHIIRYTYTAANGCSNYQEQKVSVYPLPVVDAGPDRVILEGGQITMTPNITANFPVTYLWTPAQYLSNATIANPVLSGIPDDKTYTIKVTSDHGCIASDAVFVKLLRSVAIPNIFSPNGDGIHDTWIIQYLESYPGCTVDIFNRYGQRIYHSEGYTKPWDGTVDGKPVPVGTYYYIVNPKNGRTQMSGYVDVIR